MLIDDSEDEAFTLRRALRRIGVQAALEHVPSGDQALKALHAQAVAGTLPRLVLLDLNMPGTDGRDVLRALSADSRMLATPVVVLTSSEDPRDIRFCYSHGARAYQVKTYDADKLEQELAATCTYWFDVARLPRTGSGAR